MYEIYKREEMRSTNPLSLLIREALLLLQVRAALMANTSVDGYIAVFDKLREGTDPVDRFKKHDRPLTARDYFNSAR